MSEEQKIDPKHPSTRTFLRIVGPILLLSGIYCLYKLVSNFGNFDQEVFKSMPLYGLAGVGLLFVGAVMTMMGYLGAAARYQVGEMAPVVKDGFNYVAKGSADGVKTLSRAVTEGLAEGLGKVIAGRAAAPSAEVKRLVRCHKCNADNDADARFCGQCGAALAKSKPCPACGELNDPDSKFCDNCGRAYSS